MDRRGTRICWITIFSLGLMWSLWRYYFADKRFVSTNQNIRIPPADSLHCKQYALDILFHFEENPEAWTEMRNELSYAKRCWENTLLFYLNFPFDPYTGSYVLPLLASVWVTEDAILETGVSFYRSPIIHRLAMTEDRFALTAHSKVIWIKKLSIFRTDFHHLYLVNASKSNISKENIPREIDVVQSWSDIGKQANWGTVFVEHGPLPQRYTDLMRLRTKTDLIVIQDTNNSKQNEDSRLTSFKHRFIFEQPEWSATVTYVLSDTSPEMVELVSWLCSVAVDTLQKLTGEHTENTRYLTKTNRRTY